MRPRAVKQQQFEYAYIFGAVCPSTGATEALIAPFMNMDVMEKHLSLISKRAPEGRHGVIVVDGAAWHQPYLADKLDNISIIKLPPYSPELNPIEQVWQWLRQNELANRCFKGYKYYDQGSLIIDIKNNIVHDYSMGMELHCKSGRIINK